MSTALNKLNEAVSAGRGATVKVGQNKISLYTKASTGRKKSWVLCWYVGKKRHTKESSDEGIVLAKADEVIRAFEAGKIAVAALGEARLSEYVATDTALPGVSLAELLAFYEKHHTAEQGGALLSDVSAAHQASVASKGRRSRHLNTLKNHLTRLEKKFAKAPIGLITVKDLDEHLEGIHNLKTRLNHRISLVSLFNFAQRKGYLPHDKPTAAIQTERPSPTPRDVEVFTPEEAQKLLGASTGKLRVFLLLGMFAGIRTAEIHRLQWKHVREDCIQLSSDLTKTQRRRVVEIPDNLREWLAPLRGEPDDFVTVQSSTYLYKTLGDLCEKTGVTWKNNASRHSFVSYHLELHRDPSRTSKTAGHSLRMLETVYLKLVERKTAEQWFGIRPPEGQKDEDAKSNGPREDADNLCRVGGCPQPPSGLCPTQQHLAECGSASGDVELRKLA